MSELTANIQAALMGSTTAFEGLIHQLSRKLYSIAFALTQDSVAAEKVVCEVFLHGYEDRDGIRTSEDFPPWLVHETRERARRAVQPKLEGPEIHSVLLELPEKEREAFTLRHLDHLSHAVIDARLALGEGGGRKIRSQVLFKLRERLEHAKGEKQEPLPTHVESWILAKLDDDLSSSDAPELKAYLQAHKEARVWLEREKLIFEELRVAFAKSLPDPGFEERVIAKFREKTTEAPQDFLLLRNAFEGFWSRVLLVSGPSVLMFFIGMAFARFVVTEEAPVWKAPSTEQALLEEQIKTMRVQSFRTDEIEVKVPSAEEAVEAVEASLMSWQGRVQQKRIETKEGVTTAELVVRVPSIRLDPFLDEVKALGTVVSSGMVNSDPSSESRDIGKAFRNGMETEGRLVELLKSGRSNFEETLRIETELIRVRKELDTIQSEVEGAKSRSVNPVVKISLIE